PARVEDPACYGAGGSLGVDASKRDQPPGKNRDHSCVATHDESRELPGCRCGVPPRLQGISLQEGNSPGRAGSSSQMHPGGTEVDATPASRPSSAKPSRADRPEETPSPDNY